MNAERTAIDNVAGNTYDKYGSTNPIEQRMMRGFFGAFDAMLDGLSPDLVVEVGAGEGRITRHLRGAFPDATVVGLDLPDDDLAASWAAERAIAADPDSPGGQRMFFGDVTRLPFIDRSVDLVVGLEVLEHVPHPSLALAEIARVCRGWAIVSVPREPIWRIGNMARGRYVRDLGNTPGHVNHWSARGFDRFVRSGMHVERSAKPLPWTMIRARPSHDCQ